MAEFEKELIRERVRSGIARVQAGGRTRSGKPIGRPPRAVDLDKLRELRAEGRSWRACAIALKIPSRTLRSAVQRGEQVA
jgi:DNA invertase Pin-like site-specific DNA recombinase